MTCILHLPFPPSINSANNYGSKGYFPSKEKKAFFRDADGMYYEQRPRWFVKGPFTYHLTLSRKMRSATMDGDNRAKYPLDFLQRVGLIENDKLAESGSWSWGDCEFGAMISVFPVACASPEASLRVNNHDGQLDEVGRDYRADR